MAGQLSNSANPHDSCGSAQCRRPGRGNSRNSAMKSEVQPYDRSERAATADKSTVAPGRNGINGSAAAAQIPWQERPAGSHVVVWRHSGNPVIGRHHLPGVQGIYNSAVAPFGDGFVGVFRLEKRTAFRICTWAGATTASIGTSSRKADPVRQRRSRRGQRLRLRSARRARSTTRTTSPGAAGTTARRSASPPPRTSSGSSGWRTRSCRSTATACCSRARSAASSSCSAGRATTATRPFGDIYLSQSPDMCHWGMHRLVMRRGGDQVGQWWQRTKIGAGPIPIETDDGWLMIYHGVMDTCNGFVYSMGAALLDRDEPWRVLVSHESAHPDAGSRLRSLRPRAERRLPVCGALRRRGEAAGDLLRRGRHVLLRRLRAPRAS